MKQVKKSQKNSQMHSPAILMFRGESFSGRRRGGGVR